MRLQNYLTEELKDFQVHMRDNKKKRSKGQSIEYTFVVRGSDEKDAREKALQQKKGSSVIDIKPM
jgi:hypothetical protein